MSSVEESDFLEKPKNRHCLMYSVYKTKKSLKGEGFDLHKKSLKVERQIHAYNMYVRRLKL